MSVCREDQTRPGQAMRRRPDDPDFPLANPISCHGVNKPTQACSQCKSSRERTSPATPARLTISDCATTSPPTTRRHLLQPLDPLAQSQRLGRLAVGVSAGPSSHHHSNADASSAPSPIEPLQKLAISAATPANAWSIPAHNNHTAIVLCRTPHTPGATLGSARLNLVSAKVG